MSRRLTGTRNIRFCRRSRLLLLLAVLAPGAVAATEMRDPEFAKVPFKQWLSEGRQSRIHWTLDVLPAQLSTHQRLMVRMVIHVDGRELEKRRGSGEFLTLVQFGDAEGRVWQSHTSLNLDSLHESMQSQEARMTFYAFVLPGDYDLSVAICNTGTLEHSFTRRRVRVAALKNDPLPESWIGLPPVEFIPGKMETPDVWYLPAVGNRLQLPLRTERPVHLELLVNTTPSQRVSGSLTAIRHNMSVLIPALKVMTQLDIRNGWTDVALLDLTHRRVSFEQKHVRELNWDGVRNVLAASNPGIVDVHTLENQWKMRKFFWDEVSRRLAGDNGPVHDGPIHIVVVLSGPAFLEDQEPVEPSIAGNDADRRLFYIRYRTIPPRAVRQRLRPGGRPIFVQPTTDAMPVDDLEKTVEPLDPRLFDATSAEQFRRILAAVMEQLQKL